MPTCALVTSTRSITFASSALNCARGVVGLLPELDQRLVDVLVGREALDPLVGLVELGLCPVGLRRVLPLRLALLRVGQVALRVEPHGRDLLPIRLRSACGSSRADSAFARCLSRSRPADAWRRWTSKFGRDFRGAPRRAPPRLRHTAACRAPQGASPMDRYPPACRFPRVVSRSR